MLNENCELIVGFITYGNSTAKYLPYFLSSLDNQTYKKFKILVIDNSENSENENKKIINKNYAKIDFKWAGENIGFSRAYNQMIAKSVDLGAKYFLMLNPDIILKEDAIEKMIKIIEKEEELGSVCPKILKWDFEETEKALSLRGGTTKQSRCLQGELRDCFASLAMTGKIIDTCGIKLISGLRFIDVGQGQVDKGQFNEVNILGPSGACAMYRISALKNIKQGGQFFDELMFMYKEDCDLAYRLFICGYKSKCVPGAVIYHDRTAGSSGRSIFFIVKDRCLKSKKVKIRSFLNQQIIFCKYWNLQNFYSKLKIIFYEIKAFIFILFFERYLFKEFFNLWRMRKKIKIY